MAFRLYNSLTKKVEEFRPADPSRITFYSCGPTVYDFAHIGNFRSFLAADVLRRWLESPLCEIETGKTDAAGKAETHRGPRQVIHVMNITDVGHMTEDDNADGGGVDRMEEGGRRVLELKKAGKLPPGAPADIDPSDPYAIAEFYANAFLEDARLLGLKVAIEAEKQPELMPRPTGKHEQMQERIRALHKRGLAYIIAGPSGVDGGAGTAVYFDVSAYDRARAQDGTRGYGDLSGNTLDKLRAGAGGRVTESAQRAKRHPADFLLWKVDPQHKMSWQFTKASDAFDTFEKGYPGWHIECTAMAREIFGETLDLHSGGEDNIFPHHECEIAQSVGETGKSFEDESHARHPHFARHWMHVRHLMVEGAKMSKSKGNFFTIRDLIAKGFDPAAIRLELIKTHYRSNADFTEQGLVDSQRRIERWRRYAAKIEAIARHDLRASPLRADMPAQATLADACAANLTRITLGSSLSLERDFNVGVLLAHLDEASAQDVDERIRERIHAGHPSSQPDLDRAFLESVDKQVEALPTEPLSFEEIHRHFLDWRQSWSEERIELHLADRILGVIFMPRRVVGVDPRAVELKSHIDAARAAKNYAESDRLRAEAEAAGYEVRMSKDGATVTKRAGL